GTFHAGSRGPPLIPRGRVGATGWAALAETEGLRCGEHPADRSLVVGRAIGLGRASGGGIDRLAAAHLPGARNLSDRPRALEPAAVDQQDRGVIRSFSKAVDDPGAMLGEMLALLGRLLRTGRRKPAEAGRRRRLIDLDAAGRPVAFDRRGLRLARGLGRAGMRLEVRRSRPFAQAEAASLAQHRRARLVAQHLGNLSSGLPLGPESLEGVDLICRPFLVVAVMGHAAALCWKLMGSQCPARVGWRIRSAQSQTPKASASSEASSPW